MNKVFLFALLFVGMLLYAANSYADCIISIREVAVSPDGKTGTYKIKFDVSSMSPEYPINYPCFRGTSTWDDTLKVYYTDLENFGNGIAEVTIKGWERGKLMTFLFGVIYNDGYGAQAIDNSCSPKYRREGTNDDFQVILPEPPPPPPPPKGATNIPTITTPLLLKKDK